MKLTRRQFVARTSAGLSLVSFTGGMVPAVLRQAAAADGLHQNRILVVIELSGGNDGLNTVIPWDHAEYHQARPELAVREGLHRLDEQFALHPSLTDVARLFQAGQAAIVHGVGYPQPNRSHFRSMEIWQTGRPDLDSVRYGWLGRFLDTLNDDEKKLAGIAFTERLPQSLQAARANIPAVRDIENYGLFVDGEGDVQLKRRVIEELSAPRPGVENSSANLSFLMQQAQQTYAGVNQLREATRKFQPRGEYAGDFGQQLRMAVQVIAADLGARVIHVALDGFDTHSNQPEAHSQLLDQLSRGVGQFLQDLQAIGRADDVLVMTYSEFGRRVRENGSRGTDHGAAAPLFFFGKHVRPGFHGAPPALDDLDDGDLKFTVDFRSLYAAVLEDWFGADASGILGPPIQKLALLDTPA